MTQNFNKTSEKEKRRKLRRDQTFCEKVLWTYLRDRKTLGYKFRRQYSVDHYVIDFYCAELKLAIELDGSVHDVPDQKEYDAYRQEYLEKFGVTFCRITNDELMGSANMAFEKIEYFIKETSEKCSLSFPCKRESSESKIDSRFRENDI